MPPTSKTAIIERRLNAIDYELRWLRCGLIYANHLLHILLRILQNTEAAHLEITAGPVSEQPPLKKGP